MKLYFLKYGAYTMWKQKLRFIIRIYTYTTQDTCFTLLISIHKSEMYNVSCMQINNYVYAFF